MRLGPNIHAGIAAILGLEAKLVCDLYGLHEQYVIIGCGCRF